MPENTDVCVLISAGAEWRAFIPHFGNPEMMPTPYGDYFNQTIQGQHVTFFHGGSGKVAAAGSTQFAIDRWEPKWIINFGTCGGFAGHIKHGEIILAEKTIIYDIIEKMSDPDQAIERYSVSIDLSTLPETLPQDVKIAPILSADRDILSVDIPGLIKKYEAFAADWESGAIAWVARQNRVPCLILRAVSDLVDIHDGEAYGNYAFFESQCRTIMLDFAHHLPEWIAVIRNITQFNSHSCKAKWNKVFFPSTKA